MAGLENTLLKKQYLLRRFVDSGGMADVYLALDQLRSAPMAIKILRPELAANEQFVTMFAKEAQLLQQLSHPHIVRLYEFCKEGGLAFLVMDWVNGENVRRLIVRQNRPLTCDETLRIIDPVCRALSYAHQMNVYHCDVKPANILLHADGRAVLTDFGVAYHAAGAARGGTPAYMAPEQFTHLSPSNPINPRTDVYSLGITIYEMLSGGWVPYRGDTPGLTGGQTRERIAWELTHLPLPSIRQYNPLVPPAVEKVIQIALNKDPKSRFASALEFKDALTQAVQSAQSGRGIGAPTTPNAPPKQPPGLPPARTPLTSPRMSDSSPQVETPRRPTPQPRTPTPTPSAPPAAEKALLKARFPCLFGLSGEWVNKVIEIPRGGIQIGRSSTTQIQLREESVSRLHATIQRALLGKSVYLQDENSLMGVFINGQRVAAATPIELKNGDLIQIGKYQIFEFRTK